MKKVYHVYKNWYWEPAILVRNLCYLAIILLILWPVASYFDYLFNMRNPELCASWNFWLWLI